MKCHKLWKKSIRGGGRAGQRIEIRTLLPDCQGSHDVLWLHLDREKDCGLKIPLTLTAMFQLEESWV